MEKLIRESACGRKPHVVAIPYPAQGHIVPLMQLCKKLAREADFMVTFVNTEHNHARMLQAEAAQGLRRRKEKVESMRLVDIPGGRPPELHGDTALVAEAFQASEALCGPFQQLLDKLGRDGEPATCIISDVLMSWSQECADRVHVPRVAFWTSSATVYHVIWHMYGFMLQGIHPFKGANVVLEDNNTDMVSNIPGLPRMDLNDLPIIARSDPADFIYQFLSRQLKPMLGAAALLLNTFFKLEQGCLEALREKFPVPTFAIGPLLPDGILPKDDGEFLKDGVDQALSTSAQKAHGRDVRRAAELIGSTGIFNEDNSCLEWLDKRKPGSVLYISFGSIFAMNPEQFVELIEGLEASGQSFLWAIRPGFVHGRSSYCTLLPPSFVESTRERGLMVSWAPQLSVLSHEAVGGFLTHCGWNSTLESVALGVPMLCWPDVGERRTNGRLAVTLWRAGLEFSCGPKPGAVRGSSVMIWREEVERVIRLLMDPRSEVAGELRSNAISWQWAVHEALSESGSSVKDWELFLNHLRPTRES